MTLNEIVSALQLKVLAGRPDAQSAVTGGYAADLLSCVMARARAGSVWVTLQAHVNVVAVASLLGLAGVIITEGAQPDTATCQKAEAEGVVLLSTRETTFAVVAALARLGVEAA